MAGGWREVLLGMEEAVESLALVRDLDDVGAGFLLEIASCNRCRHRVVLAVYPGCPTRAEILRRLLEGLGRIERPGLEVRLLPVGAADRVQNVLWRGVRDGRALLTVGPTGNLWCQDPAPPALNLDFRPSFGLESRVSEWLKRLWARAVPLTRETCGVPEFAMTSASLDVVMKWETYVAQCEETRRTEEVAARSSVEPAEADDQRAGGETSRTRSVREERPSPELCRRVARFPREMLERWKQPEHHREEITARFEAIAPIGDPLVLRFLGGEVPRPSAVLQELEFLDVIENLNLPVWRRCQGVLALISGVRLRDILSFLDLGGGPEPEHSGNLVPFSGTPRMRGVGR